MLVLLCTLHLHEGARILAWSLTTYCSDPIAMPLEKFFFPNSICVLSALSSEVDCTVLLGVARMHALQQENDRLKAIKAKQIQKMFSHSQNI